MAPARKGGPLNALEPERMVMRRALPFVVPALVVAFLVGWAASGADAGWSAVIGVSIVAANLVASAVATSWAARISPVMLYLVALGGFVVRMIVLVTVLLILDPMPWFSSVAFALTVVPATIALLAFEARMLSGRNQVDLWYFRETRV